MSGYSSLGDVIKDAALVGLLGMSIWGGASFVHRHRIAREEAVMNANLKRTDFPMDYQWYLRTLNGTPVHLASFKGKVLFINIWATWCPPCIGELHSIERLYSRYKNQRDVAFLIISEEVSTPVVKFMHKHSYDFPVYLTLGQRPSVLQSQAIPITFIVSKDGRIVGKATSGLNWDTELPKQIIDGLTIAGAEGAGGALSARDE